MERIQPNGINTK